MARKEILEEWFFPQVVRMGRIILPAEETAMGKYHELKNEWLKNHPKLLKEVPMVSLVLGEKDNQPGYFVRTEIMYKG